MLHSLLLSVLLVQLSSPQSTLLPLKQSNLLAVLHAPLVVLNGLPIILQIVVLNVLTEKSVCVCSMLFVGAMLLVLVLEILNWVSGGCW